MFKPTNLQINQHKTFQQEVIKHQVDEEMLGFGGDAILTANERKTFAQFEQERLQVLDDCRFKIGLVELRLVGEIQKVEDIGLLDDLYGLADRLPLLGQRQHSGFVAAFQ